MVIDQVINEMYPCRRFDVSIEGCDISVKLVFSDVIVDMRVMNVILFEMKMLGCNTKMEKEEIDENNMVIEFRFCDIGGEDE